MLAVLAACGVIPGIPVRFLQESKSIQGLNISYSRAEIPDCRQIFFKLTLFANARYFQILYVVLVNPGSGKNRIEKLIGIVTHHYC